MPVYFADRQKHIASVLIPNITPMLGCFFSFSLKNFFLRDQVVKPIIFLDTMILNRTHFNTLLVLPGMAL